MSKSHNKNELVINYLLSIEREYKGGKLTVDISREGFDLPNITEEELIYELSLLESDHLISVNFPTGHRDLSHYITVTLLSSILHYFDYKKESKMIKRNQWIQFWIPVSLYAIAIIVSIVALVLAQ